MEKQNDVFTERHLETLDRGSTALMGIERVMREISFIECDLEKGETHPLVSRFIHGTLLDAIHSINTAMGGAIESLQEGIAGKECCGGCNKG